MAPTHFVILILFSNLILCRAVQPSLSAATFTTKDIQLLDVELGVSVYNLEFDQDLYLPSISSCTGFDCANFVPSECYCDYMVSNCGVAFGADTCNCSTSLCDTSLYSWTDLFINETKTVEMAALSDMVHFRFMIDSPCSAVQLVVEKIYGSPTMYVSTKGPADVYNYDWTVGAKRSMFQYFCPSDPAFIQGTYFVAFESNTPSSFRVTLLPAIIPEVKTPPPKSSCSFSSNSSQICIENSVPSIVECTTTSKYYYEYKFTGCQLIVAALTCIGTGTDMDLYASMSNQYPYYRSSDFSSYYKGNDLITVSVCPLDGETTGSIYFTVDCWQPATSGNQSEFMLYVTNETAPYWSMKKLTDLSVYEAPFALLGATRIEKPNTLAEDWLICENWGYACDNFWNVYPGIGINPFWPFPPKLLEIDIEFASISGGFLGFVGTPESNSYQLAVVYKYTIDDTTQTLLDEDQLNKISMKFLGKITNKDGVPISMTGISATPVNVTCVYENFVQVKNKVDDQITLMGTTLDPFAFSEIRFVIDAYRYLDDFYGCQSLVNNLLTSQPQIISSLSQSCFASQSSDEWNNDPCCNFLMAWEETCVPRLVNVTVEDFAVNTALVQQQCATESCIYSYLNDYQVTAEEASRGSCSTSKATSDDYTTTTYQNYRYCKEYAFSGYACYDDQDCGDGYTCNMFTKTCNIPLNIKEKYFVTCLLNVMDKSQQIYVKEYFNLKVDVTDPTFVDSLMTLFSYNNCVVRNGSDIDIDIRDHYEIMTDPGCENCPAVTCDDTTCIIPEQTCFVWCSPIEWNRVSVTELSCTSGNNAVCNWNQDLCLNKTQTSCETDCVASQSSYFCGLCERENNCIELNLNQTECLNSNICLLPNGTYVIGLTSSECASFHSCNTPCPPTCSSLSPGICLRNVSSAAACAGIGGIYNDPYCISPSINTSAACQSIGGYFQSCQSLSVSQCIDCQYTNSCQVAQVLLQCFVETSPTCTSESECLNAGYCSDSSTFIDWTVSPVPRFGACVVPRLDPIGDSYGLYDIGYCPQNLPMFPNGCLDVSIPYSDCASSNGTWWEPASNQSTCLSPHACYNLRDEALYQKSMGSVLPVQFAYSPKNEANCTSEYNTGYFQSIFEWTSSRWISGVSRPLYWKKRQVVSKFEWAPTLNYTLVSQVYLAGASVKLALQSKSQTLCSYTRSAQTLQTVACDCGITNPDLDHRECFAAIVPTPVAEGKACSNSNTTVSAPSSFLSFNDSSIVIQDCIDITVSELSALYFQESQKVFLSANFAQVKSSTSFGVLNSNDAVVGTLVGDGSEVFVGGSATSFILCLKLRQLQDSIDKSFTVYDFGITQDSNTIVTPLGVSVYNLINSGNEYLCSVIENSNEGSSTYFPIKRMSDWKSASKQLFEPYALGLIYTLATLFTIVAALATVRIGFLLFRVIAKHQGFQLLKTGLAVCIWLFSLIRGIYFWILPTGIESNVVDYILVVFPTFLYFTIFSLIAIMWSVASTKTFAQTNAFQKYVDRLFITVNSMLYIIFIVLVSVFSVVSKVTPSVCKGRVQEDISSVQKNAQIVSIVYSTIIGALSVAIAVVFMIFGPRMYKQLRQGSMHEKSRKLKKHLSILFITGVSSIAFILHCIFILTLAGLSSPNIIFTFVGLIITELLPSSFLLLLFWRLDKSVSSSKSSTGNVNMTSMSK